MRAHKLSVPLILTSATKSEIPDSFLTSGRVFTLAALLSGAAAKIRQAHLTWIWVVTGVGPSKSFQAATCIDRLFNPKFVLNIGTCGSISRSFPLGTWLVPTTFHLSPASDANHHIPELEGHPNTPIPGQFLLPMLSLYQCLTPTLSHDKLFSLSKRPCHLMTSFRPILSQSERDTAVTLRENPKDVGQHLSAPHSQTFRPKNPEDLGPQVSAPHSQTFRPENPENLGPQVVDMEAYAQAAVFRDSQVPFHCLKMVTDHADRNTTSDYSRLLETYKQKLEASLQQLQRTWSPPSVIIPTYNRRDRLLSTLESVTCQTLSPREIIVVDDGSTDGTHQLVKAFQQTTSTTSIRYIRSDTNNGVSWARNRGIEAATSDWICLLDSDDHLHPDKFEKDSTYMKDYPYVDLYQPEDAWIRHGRPLNQKHIHKKPFGWAWESSLNLCLISSSGVMIHRSLFDVFGTYDEQLPACEDYDLWIRMLRWIPVGLQPEVTVTKYGGHDDQLSQAFTAMDRFRIDALYKAYQLETSPEKQYKLAHHLQKKLTILVKGAKKHNNQSLIDRYENLKNEFV